MDKQMDCSKLTIGINIKMTHIGAKIRNMKKTMSDLLTLAKVLMARCSSVLKCTLLPNQTLATNHALQRELGQIYKRAGFFQSFTKSLEAFQAI
jgi:hypothetical protein